jgi:hypothetical protein
MFVCSLCGSLILRFSKSRRIDRHLNFFFIAEGQALDDNGRMG